MNRRQLFGALGAAGTATLMAGSVSAVETGHEKHAAHFDACAKACADCQIECHKCSHHCAMLTADGKKDHIETLRFCVDCGDICASAANIMARRGILAATVCRSCIEACEKCAKACEKFPDDKHMKACADECKKCAKACREMLEHIGKDAK